MDLDSFEPHPRSPSLASTFANTLDGFVNSCIPVRYLTQGAMVLTGVSGIVGFLHAGSSPEPLNYPPAHLLIGAGGFAHCASLARRAVPEGLSAGGFYSWAFGAAMISMSPDAYGLGSLPESYSVLSSLAFFTLGAAYSYLNAERR